MRDFDGVAKLADADESDGQVLGTAPRSLGAERTVATPPAASGAAQARRTATTTTSLGWL